MKIIKNLLGLNDCSYSHWVAIFFFKKYFVYLPNELGTRLMILFILVDNLHLVTTTCWRNQKNDHITKNYRLTWARHVGFLFIFSLKVYLFKSLREKKIADFKKKSDFRTNHFRFLLHDFFITISIVLPFDIYKYWFIIFRCILLSHSFWVIYQKIAQRYMGIWDLVTALWLQRRHKNNEKYATGKLWYMSISKDQKKIYIYMIPLFFYCIVL